MHEEIKTSIVELVETLVERTSQVMHYTEQIPEIEIDLVMTNLQQIYSLYGKLSKLNQSVIRPLPLEEKPIVSPVVEPLFSDIPPSVVMEEEEAVEVAAPVIVLSPEVKEDAPNTVVAAKIQETIKTPSIAEKLQQRMHASLKSSIGINERFAFSKNLFKDNSSEYNMVIAAIDQQATFEEALLVIAPYKEKYNWETKEEVWDSFMQLLRNKYGK